MRIVSSNPESPDFWRKHFKMPEIYLDGVVVDEVLWADDVTGEISVIDYDEGGRPRYAGERFITKTLTGVVRIEEKKE